MLKSSVSDSSTYWISGAALGVFISEGLRESGYHARRKRHYTQNFRWHLSRHCPAKSPYWQATKYRMTWYSPFVFTCNLLRRPSLTRCKKPKGWRKGKGKFQHNLEKFDVVILALDYTAPWIRLILEVLIKVGACFLSDNIRLRTRNVLIKLNATFNHLTNRNKSILFRLGRTLLAFFSWGRDLITTFRFA